MVNTTGSDSDRIRKLANNITANGNAAQQEKDAQEYSENPQLKARELWHLLFVVGDIALLLRRWHSPYYGTIPDDAAEEYAKTMHSATKRISELVAEKVNNHV